MEFFEIVNESGEVIGTAPRSECHGDPSLVHRAAHVLVINTAGQILLQLRARTKDIQPGRWDTSVGGHLSVGETYEEAAAREMAEELGITGTAPIYLYDYRLRNEVESEDIRSFYIMYDGPVVFQAEEIDAVRLWEPDEIRAKLGTGVFTPNFETEFALYEDWRSGRG